MADKYTKDKRYRIAHYIEKDSNSYFESDTRWRWEVTDTKTNKLITTFSESYFANASGSEESGAKDVSFSLDEKTVIATYYDGSVEQVDLKTGKVIETKRPDDSKKKKETEN